MAIINDILKQDELAKQGYTRFPLLDATVITALTDYYSRSQTEDPQHFYSSTHSPDFNFRRQTSEFIKKQIEPLLSPVLNEYSLLGGAFVVKPAHGKGILQAHQDWNLVDETHYRSYNLWIPLVDVSEKNGAMCVLDASHTKIQTIRGPHIPSVFKDIEQHLWTLLKPLPMKAGEALLYDHALLHGSPPNNSDTARLGIVIGIVNKGVNLKLYAKHNGEIAGYQCDEHFFLDKNTLIDFTTLTQLENALPEQPVLTLPEFEKIFSVSLQSAPFPAPQTNTPQAQRTFFQTYTPKNIIAEIKYRLTGKVDAQQQPEKEIKYQDVVGERNVARFYNEQTDNFLKVYGNVIQAFRTKDISVLLEYQINAIGLKKGVRALDAGCGVCGPAAYFAEKTDCHIEAMTISAVQVEKARQHVKEAAQAEKVNVSEGDYHKLNNYYAKDSFDVIYFLESFGHAHSHEEVLNACWKVLKPGGSIYIKDLFIKKALFKGMEQGIQKEIDNINKAYHYNVPDLNTILDSVRKKGFIVSSLKTIDIPLEAFENLTISNDFQELTGINKIENLREYVFPVDFFELKLIKPDIDIHSGNSRYFLQNMYLMQIENWKERDL